MSSTNRGGQRSPADFYATPRWVTRRLLEHVDLPGGRWLECAAGDGAIINAVNESRSDVSWYACELRPECAPLLEPLAGVTIGDFLSRPVPTKSFDVVITNPPFSIAMPMLRHALKMGRHVVFLLRLNFLGSEERSAFFRSQMPDIYVLPNRPSFTGKGTDSIEYAWFHFKPSMRLADGCWPPCPRGQIQMLDETSLAERKAL